MMLFLKISFLVLIKIHIILAHNTFYINFIKQYVFNELTPTILHSNLCWDKSTQLHLFRELSSKGVRISYSLNGYGKLQDQNILFLVDLNCPGAEVAFNMSSFLRFPFRWLVLYQKGSSMEDSKMELLLNLPLLVDSDFVLAERQGQRILLTEMHKPSPNGPTMLTTRGYFSGSLTDVRLHRELYRRRKDIMGHPITMSNVIQESNLTMYHLPREDRLDLHHDAIAKLSWVHVKTALSMLNATPRYIFSHRWGYIKDGQWSGMINDLRTGKADIGTNCVANSKRLEVVVFTDSIAQFKVMFIYRQPPLSYTENIFSLPFSKTVWVALVCSIVVSTLSVYVASKWETKRIGLSPTQLDGISDALLLTLSAVSQQGCSKEPKGLSGRIILWVVFAALMALYAAYSAYIVVLLQAPSNNIRSLKELAESGITLAGINADYNLFVFRMYKDPVRTAIFKKVEPPKEKPHYYDLYEGVEKIRQGYFAFHAVVDAVYRRVEETFLEIEKCDLREMDFMNARFPLVPIYKHSPYLELLRVVLKRVRESGLQDAMHGRYFVSKPKCAERITAFSSVGLLNLRPVLFFMLYGVALSVFILLLEIVLHRIEFQFNL